MTYLQFKKSRRYSIAHLVPAPRIPLLACLALVASTSCESSRPEQHTTVATLLVVPQSPPSPEAWSDAITALIDLPAPAPDWRQYAPYADNPPPDDAPEHILVAWWSAPSFARYKNEPSDTVRERLLQAVPRAPEWLSDLLRVLPDTPRARAIVSSVVAREKKNQKSAISPNSLDSIDRWLHEHDPRPLAKLRDAVQNPEKPTFSTRFFPSDSYAEELLKREPATARALLMAHAIGKDMTLSVWAWSHLVHAAQAARDTSLAAESRAALQALTVDKSQRPHVRGRAIDALMSFDWPGRDSWFVSLFSHKSLNHLIENSRIIMAIPRAVAREPDRLIPQLLPLVGHREDHVHSLAVRCLMAFERPSVLRALLPWLHDNEWIRGIWYVGDRRDLITNLGKVSMPEAIPGLIQVVLNGDDRERADAAEALAGQYKSHKALPAMRTAALSSMGEEYHRNRMWRAMTSLAPLPVQDVRKGILEYATLTSDDKGRALLKDTLRAAPRAIPGGVSLGMFLEKEPQHVPEAAVAKVLELFGEKVFLLPRVTRRLRQLIMVWDRPAIMRRLMRDWQLGLADAKVIQAVLSNRQRYAKVVAKELMALIARGGFAGGIATAVLGASPPAMNILKGRYIPAQIALLAGARQARLHLPETAVEPLLDSNDQRLVKVARRYLISADTAESRAILYRRHTGDLLILGPDSEYSPELDEKAEYNIEEHKLKERLRADATIVELYALLSYARWHDPRYEFIIEMRADAATLIRAPDADSKPMPPDKVRRLSDAERAAWLSFLAETRPFDLPPLNSDTQDNGQDFTLVHLTRHGGRRLSMNYPGFRDPASAYDMLMRRLDALH